MSLTTVARRARGSGLFVLVLLAIEFMDEFVFGAREAAWPAIRAELSLSYEQIGLLISLPIFIASLIEPILGILGDTRWRRAIVLTGGLLFALELLLTAISGSFWLLLLSFILLAPSSGAFVSLSQSTLMDLDPARHEHNMARWTFAGSVGVVLGTLAVGLLGWRAFFLMAAALSLGLALYARRIPFTHNTASSESHEPVRFRESLRNALRALRRREVLRWLTLLEFSDLMLDVLLGYLALYFVDVVGVDQATAGAAVAVWAGVGLLGDFLIIPLLERVRGLTYLRVSVVIELVLYPAFLIIPGVLPKMLILGLLGMFNAGWYSILQGRLYSAMPGQSGAVLTLDNIFGLAGSLIPFGIGLAAAHFGLDAAMWLLLLGPLALLVGLPRKG